MNFKQSILVFISLIFFLLMVVLSLYTLYSVNVRWVTNGHVITIGSDYPVSGIELANGSILATWTPMKDDYDMTANIIGSLSGDGGVTWSSPFVVVNNTGKKLSEEQYIYSNGSLFQFYDESDESNYQSGIEPSKFYVTKSLDGSVTNWSPVVKISEWPHYFTITSPPVRLTSGRWVIPVEYVSGVNISKGICSVLYSDDFDTNGLKAHWERGADISVLDHPLWEFAIVEATPNNLTGLMRDYLSDGGFWKSYSNDGGIAWGHPEPSGIPSPNARAHLAKLSNGKILLLYNNNPTYRDPLSVAILNPSSTSILKSTDLDSNDLAHVYHNMGIVPKKDGGVVIIAATDDIALSYWSLPFGITFGDRYTAGVKAYIIDPSFLK